MRFVPAGDRALSVEFAETISVEVNTQVRALEYLIQQKGVPGIEDIAAPRWGDAQHFGPGDVPVFWACGVTPQAVALKSKPPFMITHSPGSMFITDVPNASLAAF